MEPASSSLQPLKDPLGSRPPSPLSPAVLRLQDACLPSAPESLSRRASASAISLKPFPSLSEPTPPQACPPGKCTEALHCLSKEPFQAGSLDLTCSAKDKAFSWACPPHHLSAGSYALGEHPRCNLKLALICRGQGETQEAPAQTGGYRDDERGDSRRASPGQLQAEQVAASARLNLKASMEALTGFGHTCHCMVSTPPQCL